MTRLRAESGLTLVELLIAMTLMLVVMGATLTTFDNYGSNRKLQERQNDAVEQARATIDKIVKQGRNLASPTPVSPTAIDKAEATDFVFQTFEPNKLRLRYCLSDDPSVPNVIYRMTQTALAAPNTVNCRTTTPTWSKIVRVAENIVNQRPTPPVPIFTYNWTAAQATANQTQKIRNIGVQIYIDVTAADKRPEETYLASGAALRNQNEAPVARFSVQPAGPRRFILNATTSSDPEGRNLIYTWYTVSSPGATPAPADKIGNGSLLDFTFPATTTAGTRYFKVDVFDSNLHDVCPANGTGATTPNCPDAATLRP